MTSSEIGFIGLGAMGYPMAGRIAAAGHHLVVCDLDVERMGRFAAEFSAESATSPAGLAGRCGIIITMLPTSAVVEAVLCGAGGALAALRPGTIIVEMSSGVPSQTGKLARLVGAAGGVLIDAPVSGGVARARTGELAIMVGGDPQAIGRAEPVLRTMGSAILRTGSVGSAHAMKALNNLVSAAGFLAGIEALLVGKQFGIDPAVMVDILNASTGVNNSTQKKFKQFVISRSFASGFGLDLMVKDLAIALDLARETGMSSPFSELCRKIWADAAKELGPGRDHTELARAIEQREGVELG
jgi:3-hydroxyisobutyrate dehydrogenase